MTTPGTLRDFIYFDVDKATSIFSQLSGGLITGIETRAEDAQDQRNIRKYDLKLFKPEFGGVQTSTQVQQESRILHHDLFSRIEGQLFNEGYALDVSAEFSSDSVVSGTAHERLSQAFYIRVEGWAVIEDYERMKSIAARYNRIAEFIARCGVSELEQTEEFQALQQQIEAARQRVEAIKDKNKRSKEDRTLRQLQQRFQEQLTALTGLSGVAPWLVEGMGEFIDTFMPDRINLRIYPFDDLPVFNVVGNLRRTCFVDADIENLLFAYGSRPNVKLTMFGLVTSLPGPDAGQFDPMSEFDANIEISPESADQREFEKGFRGVFRGFEGFENMIRYSRYPNVTVYPVAVYRDIRPTPRQA